MVEKYSLTEEHKAQLKPWADKWIANALSTAPMTQEDRDICVTAAIGMYAAANLKAPRVVFVSSPIVGAFAAGYAAAIVYRRKQGLADEFDLSDTSSEVVRATLEAVGAAPPQQRKIARQKKKPDTSKWYVLPQDYRKGAEELGVGKFGLDCAARSWGFRQGGNQWSGWSAYLSFFRHVVKLGETHGVDFSKWAHWETLSERSGVRYVHEDFCIISDRPRVLKVDDQNRPHCPDGPYCEWSDGFALYAFRGTRIPAKWILDKSSLTPETALTHSNIEERRAAAEILGWAEVLAALKPVVIDEDRDPEIGTLLQVDLPDSKGSKFLKVRCGTGRSFVLPVPSEMKTALQANAWTYNLEPGQFQLEART